MRVLHISDLHIGAHNENLLANLRTRVEVIKPDVIVATGDLADGPWSKELTEAHKCLYELAARCPPRKDGAAALIVVPGNHDFGYIKGNAAFNLSTYRFSNYRKIFGALATNSFYGSERVWIYGFNSAREWGVGANGEVLQSDLTRFDDDFEKAQSKYQKDFTQAYKIVALHHHPLPVRFDPKLSRWVTLLNSAEFLDQMLKRNIDLVIHGHEHVHAQAVFSKRFSGDDRSLTVVSVGTVSHKDPGADRNRFNVIEIESNGSIKVKSYQAQGGTFDADPTDSYVVRDTMEYDDRRFKQIVTEKGYSYDRVISQAELQIDGDVKRSVEFRGLVLKNGQCQRARNHHIALPQTSGYIDLPTAWEMDDSGEATELTFRRSTAVSGDKRVEGTIEYDGPLAVGVPFSLRCRWWAVNAMAMSKEQSWRKYPALRSQEYTHFPVLDPVVQMTCMLSFPPGFSPATPPTAFVAPVIEVAGQGLHVGEPDRALQNRLRRSVDVDGSVATGIKASMNITRPTIGYTYGFRWTLPDDIPKDGGMPGAEAAEIVAALLAFHNGEAKDVGQKERIARTLGLAGEQVRASLAQRFAGDLESSLMVFDAAERKMITVAACQYRGGKFEWIDRNHIVFEYGEGIGGRAFKTKLPLIYYADNQSHAPRRTEPDFYRKAPGDREYAVLFALPIHHPEVDKSVYAVLCCGSLDGTCPLRNLGSNGAAITSAAAKADQKVVSQALYRDLIQLRKAPSGSAQT
jgi:3',5'-cyclic AMP phosphodiesterase CpdA